MAAKEYSPAMLIAYEDTIWAYEQAIYDLEHGQATNEDICDVWADRHCRLCVAAEAGGVTDHCGACVIYCEEDDSDCMEETFEFLGECCLLGSNVLPALKARLRWLIKRAESNGVYLEV